MNFLILALAIMQPSPIATPASKLAWDQPAPDLSSAQGYTYKYYPDGSTTAGALIGTTCSGTVTPFQCEVQFPTFVQGNHTLKLSATNVAGETLSDPFAFAFVDKPGKPINIHIK